MMRVMLEAADLTGSTLRIRPTEVKGAIARAVEARALPLVAKGRVKIPIDSTCPLAQAARSARAHGRQPAHRQDCALRSSSAAGRRRYQASAVIAAMGRSSPGNSFASPAVGQPVAFDVNAAGEEDAVDAGGTAPAISGADAVADGEDAFARDGFGLQRFDMGERHVVRSADTACRHISRCRPFFHTRRPMRPRNKRSCRRARR